MIAKCKFCQVIIHPVAVLPLKPAQLAKIPPPQLEVMKFSAGVTEHMRADHAEYVAHVQALSGTFLGHCMVSAVEVAGEYADVFEVISRYDDAVLRATWEALPNPPHPDIMAQLQDEAQTQLRAVERDREEKEKEKGQGKAQAAAPSPLILVPPPPGKIGLN